MALQPVPYRRSKELKWLIMNSEDPPAACSDCHARRMPAHEETMLAYDQLKHQNEGFIHASTLHIFLGQYISLLINLSRELGFSIFCCVTLSDELSIDYLFEIFEIYFIRISIRLNGQYVMLYDTTQ